MFFLFSVGALSVVYLVVAFLERAPALRVRLLTKPRPYLATDTAWYGLAILATAVSMFVFRPLLSRLAIGAISGPINQLPVVGRVLLGLVLFDFVSFWVHVGMHRSDVLWNVHKVHHSTLELDGFATTRTHMAENLLRFVPPQAVLFLIGLPPQIVAPTVAVAAIYGVWNHSNLGPKLRWPETLLVTPRLHRRHHIPSTSQNNFGAIFTIWDRAFGTLVQRDTAPSERFGVPGEVDTYPQRFAAAFRQPLVQIRDLRARTRRRPSRREGFSPDSAIVAGGEQLAELGARLDAELVEDVG